MKIAISIFAFALTFSLLSVSGEAQRAPVTPAAASAPTSIPALVPYSGVAVASDGKPLTGEAGMTFLIYKEEHGGEPLWVESQTVGLDPAGRYKAQLGATNPNGLPSDLFADGEARWLEVQIAGEVAQPRALIASVPYALKAADAATLGGLPASAFALAGSQGSLALGAVSSAGIVSNATSNVTTTGGTSGYLPVFTGTSTVVNSKLYSSSTGIGVGDVPNASAVFDVNGKSIWRGLFNIVRAGNATTSTGYASFPMLIQASAYNSTSKAMFLPSFQLQVEPAGNNTANTGATFNFLYTGNNGTPAETGLYINDSGTIHFASGQTFPGGTGGGSALCIATGGGFGSGGTTFVGPSFAVPAVGGCAPWSGFTKTASTVVLTTSGAACLSTDSKQLTLNVSSADPNYVGAGSLASDYIQLNRTSTTGSFTSGSDQGYFSGSAQQVTCTSTLLQLNENND